MSQVGFSKESFRSPETFEIFVSSVYTRLHICLVTKERYLEDCISRLTDLLEIAEQCGEDCIVKELDNALSQFHVEKECVSLALNSFSIRFKIATEPHQTSQQMLDGLGLDSETDGSSCVVYTMETMESPVEVEIFTELQNSPQAECLDSPCLPDPVLEQRFAKLNETYMEWRDVFSLQGDNHRYGLWFELRAIACDLMALIVSASASGGNQDVIQASSQLLDSLQFDNNLGNNISECFPFPLTISSITETSDAKWTKLATNYRDMLSATEAWEWYMHSATTSHLDLLNGIGAASQQLYRQLESVNLSDQLQFEFYDAVQSWCKKDNTYCRGLDCKITDGELNKLILQLPQYLDCAKKAEVYNENRAASEIRKKQAIDNLKKLFEDNEEFGQSKDTLEEDRETLKAHLDSCKEAGIPFSDSTVCGLIMHCATHLLSGQNNYLQFLKFAMEKLKKSKINEALETAKEEATKQASDPELTTWVELLKPVVENKQLLILGGERCKDAVCSKLKDLLPLTECDWGYGNAKATAGRYRTKIQNADITIVAIAFAGHDMSEKGRKWANEAGKDFIQNHTGMGLKAIVKTMFDYYSLKGMIQTNG